MKSQEKSKICVYNQFSSLPLTVYNRIIEVSTNNKTFFSGCFHAEHFLSNTSFLIVCMPTEQLCLLVTSPLFLYLVPYLPQFTAVEYIIAEN